MPWWFILCYSGAVITLWHSKLNTLEMLHCHIVVGYFFFIGVIISKSTFKFTTELLFVNFVRNLACEL